MSMSEITVWEIQSETYPDVTETEAFATRHGYNLYVYYQDGGTAEAFVLYGRGDCIDEEPIAKSDLFDEARKLAEQWADATLEAELQQEALLNEWAEADIAEAIRITAEDMNYQAEEDF